MSNLEQSQTPTSAQISTEQYMYRRIADMCLAYFSIDRHMGKSRDAVTNRTISRELANIFESIRSFAREEKQFPDHLKNPPLNDWTMRETRDPTLFVLAPRYAKDYVMAVYKEIQKQQSTKTRDANELANEAWGDNK